MTTAEKINAELAETEARRERLQAKANAINTAVREAHDRVEKSYYRRMATKVATEHRNQRDAAKAELDAAMVADPLDPIKLAAKLVALKDADARCGAVAAHAGRLDYLDPLPPNAIGAPRARPVLCSEIYQQLTLWQVTDQAIAARADRIRAAHQAELQAEAAAEISAAVDNARAAAAAEVDTDN
jgi:hypothetical protein